MKLKTLKNRISNCLIIPSLGFIFTLLKINNLCITRIYCVATTSSFLIKSKSLILSPSFSADFAYDPSGLNCITNDWVANYPNDSEISFANGQLPNQSLIKQLPINEIIFLSTSNCAYQTSTTPGANNSHVAIGPRISPYHNVSAVLFFAIKKGRNILSKQLFRHMPSSQSSRWHCSAIIADISAATNVCLLSKCLTIIFCGRLFRYLPA